MFSTYQARTRKWMSVSAPCADTSTIRKSETKLRESQQEQASNNCQKNGHALFAVRLRINSSENNKKQTLTFQKSIPFLELG